jgi:hypothetical protein
VEAVVDSFYSVDAPVVVYDEKAVDYVEVDPKEPYPTTLVADPAAPDLDPTSVEPSAYPPPG